MNTLSSQWPVLKSYDQDHLGRIGLPLGGIGTGTISLGGRGNLFDWEIRNIPGKNKAVTDNFHMSNYGAHSLFVIHCVDDSGTTFTRALEGELQPPYEGSHGSPEGFHGVPRFRECQFETAYPLGQVVLDDPDAPVSVRLQAFNPLVPGDTETSSMPAAVLRYVVSNTSDAPVSATVCGSMNNFINGNVRTNAFRGSGSVRGLFMSATGGDALARDAGTMALAILADDVTVKSVWPQENWRRPLLHFWDDLVADGKLDDAPDTVEDYHAFGSLATRLDLAPGETQSVTFIIAWHFPNRYNWAPTEVECSCSGKKLNPEDRIGNYYTEQFADAWDAVTKTAEQLDELERRTVEFVQAFCGSDLPEEIKESALFNVSTLRSETCFRTPDGNLYGWEGCCDGVGCCLGSCTHVWNYETTTAFLFGDLARTMRDVEFLHATHADSGQMSFRVNLPLKREKGEGSAAADGQMGCVMKAYREWKLSGDDEWLKRLWPKIRKALEFCWIEGGWDADKDGVMEGCQHNTMDVEYFGPNAQMGSWYLGALLSAEQMALAVGEEEFAADCRRLFTQGSKWLDANLFNGEYYEQDIRPADSADAIHPGLIVNMGAKDVTNPDLQLGSACLIDQLVGEYMARVCGLEPLLEKENVRKTLSSIMKYNFRENFHDHFNNSRTYALNDESAILMATYPHGNRPESPFPYFNEVMTGFEYTAAAHMLYEGLEEEGLKAIRAIRKRYDGRRRSPFNEAECGHHYARAMAAWTGLLAWTGFGYDAAKKTMRFAAREGQWFWSTGYAYGTCDIRKDAQGKFTADLNVLGGAVDVAQLIVEEA